MMNTLLCTMNLLGFQEVTKEEVVDEENLVAQFHELSFDGDVLVFPTESEEEGNCYLGYYNCDKIFC